jgi:hypothetical protein
MRRYLLSAVAAVSVVGLVAAPAAALMIARLPIDSLALTTPVIVTGKVTSIDKDTVDASSPYAGATDKIAYKVATVKIDKALAGADGITHIKIGFIPPAPPAPNGPGAQPGIRPIGRPIRPGLQLPELKVDQESLFFLAKHPKADFYVLAPMAPPVDIKTDDGKKQLDVVTKALAAVAEPLKGLKSDKAEVRLDTATKLVTRYRGFPLFAAETEQVAIPAEESKLILKTLADADWKVANGPIGGPVDGPLVRPANPYMAFAQLGLTDKDGFVQPMPQQQPGVPVDYVALQKEAFTKWLAGPGKDYVIKKVVAKKATDK